MRHRPLPFAAALAALLVPLASSSSLSAQEFRGTFVEADTGEPVEGALVKLESAESETAAAGLTGADGAVRLDVASAGRFRLVVERIGFESWRSEVIELAANQVERRLFRIPVQPVDLGGISVSVEDRCRVDPRTGRATARLWEEIRQALERERLTRAERRVSYRVREYRRELDGRLRVVSEDASTTTTDARSPYRAVSVEALATEGFVGRNPAGDWLYRAPDADVLLSETFQQSHCFGIIEGEGRLGLTFRPVDDRHLPEIEGTLWVDAETAALEEVRFHYTDLGLPVADSVARGQVAFERSASGDWYVERWWIRWPRLVEEGRHREQRVAVPGVRRVPRDRRVVAYSEVGASVTSLVDRQENAEPEARAAVGRGTITGTVFDSLAGGPARGVEVRIRGTRRRARTDREGQFVFRRVPEGRYRVSFAHPVVPDLPDSLTAATVEVKPNWSSEVRLTGPGSERLHGWVCGDEEGGLVIGRVVAEEGGEPMTGARVWFDWQGDGDDEAAGALAAAAAATHRGSVEADSAGRFLVCGVAVGRPVILEARGGRDTLTLAADRRIAAVELRADPDAALELAGREASGGGTELVGTVVSKETGEPLPGARLELIDAGREATAERGGRFRVTDLRPGSHRLVVDHLGFQSDTVRVTLQAAASTFVRLMAETEAVEVAGLEVEVERRVRDRRLAGFYRRMDSGLGRFASKEQVERRGVLGAVRRMPNVQVRPCYQVTQPSAGRPGEAIPIPGCYRLTGVARGSTLSLNQECAPDIYLDGVRIGRGDESALGTAFDVVRNLPADQIEGIEVHEPGTVPARYGGAGAGCGVMLVWTSR